MLKWALTLAAIALAAGLVGFGSVLTAEVGLAKLLFCVFLVVFVAVLLFGMLEADPSRSQRGD